MALFPIREGVLVPFCCSGLTLDPLLGVLAQPQWLQVMSDSEVEISSELLWSCIAAGKPRPTVRWLRNGQPISTQVAWTHAGGGGWTHTHLQTFRLLVHKL